MTRILKTLFAMFALLTALAIPVGGDEVADTGDVVDPGAPQLSVPKPSWYTPELHARVMASGDKGVEVPVSSHDKIELNCLGYSPPGVSPATSGVSVTAVSAGACMVSPHGCTMNFIFRDTAVSPSYYIGTAGHCVAGGNDVVAQVATRVDPTGLTLVTLANIGRVVKKVNQGIGADFALVKIRPEFKVVPGMAGAAGPTGVFCGDPVAQPVMHYGHGYVFYVGPGNTKFGEVLPDESMFLIYKNRDGFAWAGYGLPGDSGSGVMNDAGLAVGDLTHGLGVAGLPVPGLSFGMEMGAIFRFIGNGYLLVTVDGRGANCASAKLIDLGAIEA
jgi:hypothetical protein